MKKAWRLLILCLVVILCMTMAMSSSLAKPKKVIGVSSLWLGNDWNTSLMEGISSEIKKLGYEMIHTNAQGKTAQQVADVENFITKKVDGVIIAGGEGPAFTTVLKKLKAAKIPTGTVDMFSVDAVINVSSDNYNGGEKLALYIVNRLRGEGEVFVQTNSAWTSIWIRERMLNEVLKEFPKIKVVSHYEFPLDDCVNATYQHTKSVLLANPSIDCIATFAGLPAVGIVKAVREVGRKDIFVVAVDADRCVLQEMAKPDSPLEACFGQNSKLMGQMVVRYVDRAIKGLSFENLPISINAPIYMICKNNPVEWFSGMDVGTVEQAWKALYPGEKLK